MRRRLQFAISHKTSRRFVIRPGEQNLYSDILLLSVIIFCLIWASSSSTRMTKLMQKKTQNWCKKTKNTKLMRKKQKNTKTQNWWKKHKTDAGFLRMQCDASTEASRLTARLAWWFSSWSSWQRWRWCWKRQLWWWSMMIKLQLDEETLRQILTKVFPSGGAPFIITAERCS